MKKYPGHIDWVIAIPVIALLLFSISFVYSASAPYSEIKQLSIEHFFRSHSSKVAIGLIVMILLSMIDYHIWKKLSLTMIILAIVMLVAVLIMGLPTKGSSRWLNLGFAGFQPSEFAKFALILHLSLLLDRHKNYIKDFQVGLLPLILWTGLVCLLIALQPNISTTLIILIIAAAMMFIGNANILHLGGILSVFSVLIGIYAFFVWKYPVERIQAFFGSATESNAARLSHQSTQSLIAFGSGGLFGLGPGNSKQSYLFLPEAYGDFIYSIIGEEYGFIGAFIIIALFILIMWRGLNTAKKAPDTFGYYLASGIVLTIALYAFVNMAVNTGIMPTTGLPLPFISFGGTAVIFYCAATGVLLNISAQAGIYPRK